LVVEDLEAMNYLHACGFLKFFLIPTLRAHKQLLELLIGYLDPDQDSFMIDDETLKIEFEYNYFNIGLFWHGALINLKEKMLISLWELKR